MKTRAGFVSNSSSSSFILVTKEPITFEFLKREYAVHGHWAEPTIQFLLDCGSGELHDHWDYEPNAGCFGAGDNMSALDRWKELHGVEREAIVTEYLTANWDDPDHEPPGDVARAIYYKGYTHLETPNIRVFGGTRQG